MNKIIIDKDSNLVIDDDSFICINQGNIVFDFPKAVKVFIYVTAKGDMTFNIYSNLTINIFSIDSTLKVNINLYDHGRIDYSYSTINETDNNYIVNINHKSSNTISNVLSHGLNITNSRLDFLINTYIPKNSLFSISKQDSMIVLMDNNHSLIKPNLFVDNSQIEANHSAYIGHFKDDELFYLQSRGLSEKESMKLLAKAFLINKMKLSFEEKELIINSLNKYWR